MRLPKFEYFAPRTLEAALNLLIEQGQDAHVMAGGTDVMVKMTHGRLKPRAIVALQEIEGLEGVRFDAAEGLTIGATARLAAVASHSDVLKYYPALAQAILSMANVEVRNMGTVAGNLCNAAPSADSAPPLIVMGAEVTLASLKGERRLSLDQFFTGPGFTLMEHGEIMTSIRVPVPPPRSGASYKRISARCGVDIAAVGVGATATFDGEVCKKAAVVLGAVAPIPLRAMKTEGLLLGQAWTQELIEKAGNEAAEEAKPISDIRASAQWRKNMVAVLTQRALREAQERAQNA
ncbi:MAG: xanthine dehydrogenase family protein subunit M [Desulfomonile tiedjei]|nr:xanthine dehydrogenase family protein subunit M [Desulfomonile tiedjei]